MFGIRRTRRPTPDHVRLRVAPLEDRTAPAVLTYSSYFGGETSDHINAVTTDAAGNIFVAGVVGDSNFPGPGPSGTPLIPVGINNGFVSELDPTGTNVIFTRFIKADLSGVTGIAVDANDNVYITGSTGQSTGFATAGAAQTGYGGNGDAFAIKLDATTHNVAYATYIGGSQLDTGRAIAVDAAGDAFVVGETISTTGFPLTHALTGQTSFPANAGTEAFVTEISPTGAARVFSTFLGGNVTDPFGGAGTSDSHAHAVTLDKAGNVYVTGYTVAADFPTTAGAFRTSANDIHNAFVTELAAPVAATGSSILYSTFLCSPTGTTLGNSGYDIGNGIAVDGAGNILVTGSTSAISFPTKFAFQPLLDRGSPSLEDAFVTKLNPHNTGAAQLVYSTFDGGSAQEFGNAIAVDAAGNAFITGSSLSDIFNGKWPTVAPFQPKQYPGSEFVAEFTPAGAVVFNSKYGDGGTGYGIAVNSFGNVIVVGDSETATLNTTANAYQKTFPGATNNGFIALLNGATAVKTASGTDADGDQYTVTLYGPGGINVLNNGGSGSIQSITFGGTTSASLLFVNLTKKVGDGLIDIGKIVGPAIGLIHAPYSDLTGTGINLTGGAGTIVLHDIKNGAAITTADAVGQATTVYAHVINNGSTIGIGNGTLGLSAASVGTDTFVALRAGLINVTGDKALAISGDFGGHLMLSGTGSVLTELLVAGNLNGANLQAGNGSLTYVIVGGGTNGATFTVPNGGIAFVRTGATLGTTTFNLGGAIGWLQAASLNSDVITASAIGTLYVPGGAALAITGNVSANITLTGAGYALGRLIATGTVTGSHIQLTNGSVAVFQAAGFVNSTLFLGTGTFGFGGASGTLTPNQIVYSFVITGTTNAFANSFVAADVIGYVTLYSAKTNNSGTAFGVEGHKSITYVRVLSPAFTYLRGGPNPQKNGDFEVMVV